MEELSSESRKALEYRRKYRGVIGVQPKMPIVDSSVLSVVYTPAVAEPCQKIAANPRESFRYTCRGNTVALVTDGSRVLQMGGAGPLSALPNLEGKSVILKTFAGIDAFPMCLDTLDEEVIINSVMRLAPTFGAVCIIDITSPRCFTIEDRLSQAMNISVFHDDQHATAIETYAGLVNAAKIVNKELEKLKVVIIGAGAAGISIAKFFLKTGIGRRGDLILCDSRGILHKFRLEGMNWAKFAAAKQTNLSVKRGKIEDALVDADVLIGVSSSESQIVTAQMVSRMARDPIVFALSVPDPEILPREAKAGGARVVATGRIDYPNEINTSLVFPGVLRGALDTYARSINFEMNLAAARALAGLVPEDQLHEDNIIPSIMDFQVAPTLASAVAQAAMETGVARLKVDPKEARERLEHFLYEGDFPRKARAKKYKDIKEESLDLHQRYQGVVEIKAKIPVKDINILKLLYLPPNAAIPARVIARDPDMVYELTCKGNLVAVVSDGSAVLGLGNIGPRAALPVMEGKSILFHTFGGVEAFPVCIATQDTEEIIELVCAIALSFGGINLEDISAPRCFQVEEKLKERLDIPVFHDDQHGTAVVVLAGLINALKLIDRSFKDTAVVINGAGAAGMAVARMLILAGFEDIIICDTKGIIFPGRKEGMNWIKEEMAERTNPRGLQGKLADALKGADVFIGVSAPGILKPEMVKSMAVDPVIFALANPTPEIMPEQARKAGARIIATGRSDFNNQINNCLGFPGIFRGALDVRARAINDEMKLAAARALASAVPDKKLKEEFIIPNALDFHIPPKVAAAVARAAIETEVARIHADPEEIEKSAAEFLYEGKLR